MKNKSSKKSDHSLVKIIKIAFMFVLIVAACILTIVNNCIERSNNLRVNFLTELKEDFNDLNYRIERDKQLIKYDQKLKLVVTAKDIAPGHILTEGDLKVIEVSRVEVPLGASDSLQSLAGKKVKTDLVPGQPVIDLYIDN